MKKWISELSGWYRVAFVMSLIWIIGVLIGIEPRQLYSQSGRGRSYVNIDDFLLIGVLPVVIFWGLIWIVKGFKKSEKA